MNIYYCETCGIRIPDAELPQGLAPDDDRLKRCAKHRITNSKANVAPAAPVTPGRGSGTGIAPTPARASGANTVPVPLRNSSVRVRTPQKGGAGAGGAHPSGRHGENANAQSNLTLKIIAGMAGLFVLVFLASLFSGSDKHDTGAKSSGTNSGTGTTVARSTPQSPEKTAAPVQPASTGKATGTAVDIERPRTTVASDPPARPKPPEPEPDPKATVTRAPEAKPMGFMSGDGGVDIREELAHDHLAEVIAQEKDGKHTPLQVRNAYRKFISANASTKAAKEAETRLKALPAAPTFAIAGLKEGLVGCWSWDDSGPDAPDRSGHDVDGEIDGAERTADKPPALSFDGNGNAVNMPTEPYREITKSFTILCWAKPNAPRAKTNESVSGTDGTKAQRYAIFPPQGEQAWGRGHAGVGVSIGTNGISVFEHSGGYMPSPLVYDAELADWTHVAVVYDNNKPLLYVNGALIKEGQSGAMVTHPGAPLGGSAYGWYRGLLGEVRIYNRALAADEIKSLFNLGRR